MMSVPLLQIDLPGIPKVKSGKVREIFDLGENLLMVATDRISAFDCVMPNGIPRKGEVLTQISLFWFERFSSLIANHLVPGPFPSHLRSLARRLHAERVEANGGRALVTFAPSTPVTPERILAVIGRPGSGVSMRKEFILEATVPVGPWPKVRDALRSLLESLA